MKNDVCVFKYEDLPDYTDPTEGPSKPPPSANASSSTAAAVTVSTASPVSALLDPYSPSNSEKIVQMVEALIASNGNTSDLPTDPPALAATSSSSSPPPPPPSSSSQSSSLQSSSSAVAASTSSGTNNNRNKCGPGYFRDPMGRCRRIRKPHLP